jgi:exonuclease SbcD
MKSPIALILTDTHLKEDNIEINKSIFRQAIEIAKSLGLNQIEHGGDIFNSRKAQSQLALTSFCEILDELKEAGIMLNSCVGNHDKTDYNNADSFLDPFSDHPAFNLHRVSHSRSLTDKILLSYLSFFSDEVYVEECNALSKAIKKSNFANILLTHIGISGSVMNNGTVIESESITPTLFKDFDLTLVGHFHDAQVLANGKIKYIGASLQHNFGELTGKGVTVLYDDLSTEIIPLKYPQYIKYEISPKEITKSDIEDLKKEKQESDDNIRIVLIGSDSELKSFNKQILIDAGVSVQHKADEIQKEELEERVEPFTTQSLKDEFDFFCEKNKLNLQQGMKYFNKIINN